MELVVRHLENVVAGGQLPEPGLIEWLNQRSGDDAIGALREVRWLATADGRLAAPADVFIDDHELAPRLPVLHPSMRRFTALLSALDVRPRPDAHDAVELLIELANDDEARDAVSRELGKTITACWRLISTDSEVDLWSRAAVRHARSIGANSDSSRSNPSSRARSGGSSRTSTGSTSSNSDST